MLTHIVWWTMKDTANGKSAEENIRLITSGLESLRGRVPSLRELTVGSEILPGSTEQVSLVLVTRHDDAEGLAAYATHPEHQKVAALLKEATASRKAIDFID